MARDRQGHYTPGSIMKILTAAAALETGAITPQTTFPDQPRQEIEGFVVDGFRVLEHDLSPVQPALWALSEALQVSSNIFFAHVGLEVGPERYLDQARAFGFCSGLGIGDPDRALPVAAVLRDRRRRTATARHSAIARSWPRPPSARDASASRRCRWRWWRRPSPTTASMPAPYVVRDVRAHASRPTRGPSDQVLETLSPPGRARASSAPAPRPRCAPPWSMRSRARSVASTRARAR